MPIGDYPILEIILKQLKYFGFKEVILAVGHMSHLFKSFFEDGKRYGINIIHSAEEEALGTAGPISLVIDKLNDDFLIMNGDLLTTMNYADLFRHHVNNGNAITIGLHQRDVNIDYGVIESDNAGNLINYIEKPKYSFDVSMGINIMRKSIVQPYLKPGKALDIPELINYLVTDSHKVTVYKKPCQWLDIGIIEDYKEASKIFESNMRDFLP